MILFHIYMVMVKQNCRLVKKTSFQFDTILCIKFLDFGLDKPVINGFL